jgi:hypothetical protein
MSNISKETIDRIEKDAEVYGEEHQDHLYNVKGYSTYNDLVSGYNAGALHEAERVQPVIDIGQEVVMLFDPTRRHVLVPADVILRLSNALAKYKEVSND